MCEFRTGIVSLPQPSHLQLSGSLSDMCITQVLTVGQNIPHEYLGARERLYGYPEAELESSTLIIQSHVIPLVSSHRPKSQ